MTTIASAFEIFLASAPGLEAALADEARQLGFAAVAAVPGGVTVRGGWPEVWRANLAVRGAGRVLARVDSFRAMHLAQLDKRARRVAWAELLRPDVTVRVEATCRKSKIYHSGAAAQRIERAIAAAVGAEITEDADVTIRARIEDDLCTLAVDTSGDPLHKRGFKQAVAKAPMRETLASLFLRVAGFTGTEPVVDPMCGSGTFVIEAAEMAAGLLPGRARAFAFEKLATFDAAAWAVMRAPRVEALPALKFYGSDQNAGAIEMSRANAERAGVTAITQFRQLSADQLSPPPGPPGLVVANPPYGDRIGDRQRLQTLYRSLGTTLRERFSGWRVAIVTSEDGLARATGLQFVTTSPPVTHGGIRVTLYVTAPLT